MHLSGSTTIAAKTLRLEEINDKNGVGYRDSYVFIARKGYANNVKEKLVKHNEGFAQIEMSAAGQPLVWYYFGARYYDAEIGRFKTADHFTEMYPSLSPYQYGRNNPVLFIDINGDSTIESNEPGIDYEETNPIQVIVYKSFGGFGIPTGGCNRGSFRSRFEKKFPIALAMIVGYINSFVELMI